MTIVIFRQDWHGETLIAYAERAGYRDEISMLSDLSDILHIKRIGDGRILVLPKM